MASRQRRLQLLRNLERKYGLPQGILYGLWGAESGFAEHGGSRSPAGAVGPFQFLPSTAREYGIDPHRFSSAAKGAAEYLARYKGRGVEGMLAAYNAGPGGNPNNPETRAYIPRVKNLMDQAPYKDHMTAEARRMVRGLQRRLGRSGVTTVRRRYDPPETHVDRRAALVDALLTADPNEAVSGRPSTGLLDRWRENIDSGAYTTVTPERMVIERIRDGNDGGGRAGRAGRAHPTGGAGRLIGTPHAGTHTLGNWQSDNAVDIGVPNGTPIRAVGNGVVEKVAGSYQGGASRFDGFQVTVRLANGNRVFYTHLSRAGVRPGQRIRAGQQIGLSGSANGVPHLHIGVERGDPRRLFRIR